ncbi:MAG: bifunctional transaldolase/phosoglucose isomerase [Dehalococcoidia bacterium]|nr:bifunctional transaldolase/phosoglucose isomerase [Dehalococcoidia bacterium]
MNSIQAALKLGQSVWLDYMQRALFESGSLQTYIDNGISGITTNPTIFEKAITGSTDYDDTLLALGRQGTSITSSYEHLVLGDIRTAADLMLPVHTASGGRDGYVSIEVNPLLAHDTSGTIAEARRLFQELDRPNVMIKVPATSEGLPAIERLIAEGISVNVTLLFSLQRYSEVLTAYVEGLEERVRAGKDISNVASVASFFLSRIDTAVDAILQEKIRGGEDSLKELLGSAAVASAKVAYKQMRDVFDGQRFAALRANGAHPQRILWASTGTKNPAYSDLKYVEPLIGPDTVNTMPVSTIEAFLDHGKPESSMAADADKALSTLQRLEDNGISIEDVAGKLLMEGEHAFNTSFVRLLEGIEEKQASLLQDALAFQQFHLGQYVDDVEDGIRQLSRDSVVQRVWEHDHTVWSQDPTEISNRLAWLEMPVSMADNVARITALAENIRTEGIQDVVLIGMGGSSLGAEVLRQSLPEATGFPTLHVLDSTLPSTIGHLESSLDLGKTVFIVSSKSGTTAEPNLLYAYFRSRVEEAVGTTNAGGHFLAITDPGSAFATKATAEGFREVFINEPNVGGRYSILSYFGLVPAALAGADVTTLLQRALVMSQSCAAGVPVRDNPGACLGTAMARLAMRGRDKLTLLTSPSLSSLGLWIDQLIAESTGKHGKGIIPIVSEPLLTTASYGNDRLFVHVGMESDEDASVNGGIGQLLDAGHPVISITMKDEYALGAEFFRWEFATAIAGHMLGINPFDQPDVQASKAATNKLLSEFDPGGTLPQPGELERPERLLAELRTGSFLAIMAYIEQSPETDEALAAFRRLIGERYRVATTLGYGPRFLHSTGQLHKGGPNTGHFLQVISAHEKDIAIPGMDYSFGTVADAQALGDLQALQSLGRRVARIRIEHDDAEALAAALDAVR